MSALTLRSVCPLPDFLQQRPEPGRFRIEVLAPLDARERDGAQLAVRFFIMADHSAVALETASDSKIGHGADEVEVFLIGRGGAGEITGFLHQRPLGANELGKALREPVADI